LCCSCISNITVPFQGLRSLEEADHVEKKLTAKMVGTYIEKRLDKALRKGSSIQIGEWIVNEMILLNVLQVHKQQLRTSIHVYVCAYARSSYITSPHTPR
jgi:hypothetical protein